MSAEINGEWYNLENFLGKYVMLRYKCITKFFNRIFFVLNTDYDESVLIANIMEFLQKLSWSSWHE